MIRISLSVALISLITACGGQNTTDATPLQAEFTFYPEQQSFPFFSSDSAIVTFERVWQSPDGERHAVALKQRKDGKPIEQAGSDSASFSVAYRPDQQLLVMSAEGERIYQVELTAAMDGKHFCLPLESQRPQLFELNQTSLKTKASDNPSYAIDLCRNSES